MNTPRFLVIIVAMAMLFVHAQAAAEELSVSEHGFAGVFYPGKVANATQAVIVLGGSEGGIPTKLALTVAKGGLPTLAVGYFGVEGTPDELENIPLEYMDRAVEWLTSDGKVQDLVLVGWSKGAELALLQATRIKRVSKVVAIAPSSVAWAGILSDWTKVPGSSWTIDGKGLAHIPFKPSGPVNGLLDLYSQSLQNRTDEGLADIAVESTQAELVLLTGFDDEIWPSPAMAEQVCKRKNTAQPGSCKHFSYPGLDHLLNYKFMDTSDPMHKTFIDGITTEPAAW